MSGECNPNSSLFAILEVIERRIVVEKLRSCNWNLTDAAKLLRLPLPMLNQKIERLNIEFRNNGSEGGANSEQRATQRLSSCCKGLTASHRPPDTVQDKL